MRLDAGQNIVGLGAPGRARPRRRRPSPSATPRCSSRRATCTPRRCAAAKATDVYTLAATASTTLEPVFTFHGFRYADVETAPRCVSATAVAISSDLAPRSDVPLVASRRSTSSTRTSCGRSATTSSRCRPTARSATSASAGPATPRRSPRRRTRCWTPRRSGCRGCATSRSTRPTRAGCRRWCPTSSAAQDMLMGGVPTENMGRAGWADAATIVPLAVYESYGSTEVLERQLGSMRRWVEHLRRRAGDGVRAADRAVPVRRLARPRCARRPAVGGEGLERLRRERVLRALRAPARAGPSASSATPSRAAEYDALADRVAAATFERWGEEAVIDPDRRGARARVRPRARRTAAPRSPTASPRTSRARERPHRHRLPRHAARAVRAVAARPPRRGVPHAAAARGAVVALPGRPRRDDGVGALGCDPARRLASTAARWTPCHRGGEERRHAVVQPLRLRRDDRLGLPHGGGPRAGCRRPRVPHGARRAAPGRRARPRGGVHRRPAWAAWRSTGACDGDAFEATLEVPFGARALLDLPVTGGLRRRRWTAPPAPAELGHGTHRIAVTAPAVATPERRRARLIAASVTTRRPSAPHRPPRHRPTRGVP